MHAPHVLDKHLLTQSFGAGPAVSRTTTTYWQYVSIFALSVRSRSINRLYWLAL